jgi:hypothetical protein
MRFARRSVSDNDIRKYEASFFFISSRLKLKMVAFFRCSRKRCNSSAASARISASRAALVAAEEQAV